MKKEGILPVNLLMNFILIALILIIFSVLLSLTFASVSASFIRGNLTSNIEDSYAPGDNLRGWINLSLQNEPANSMLKAFNSNISISEFLGRLATVDYLCAPSDCEDDYSVSSESTTKTFSLQYGQEKIIGLKLNGLLQDDAVTQLFFKVSSDAKSTCNNPLQIDFLNNDLDEEDYWFFNSSNEFTCTSSSGCFNAYGTLQEKPITTKKYCEKITFEALPLFKIGAFINGTGHARFNMLVFNEDDVDDDIAKCEFSVDNSGEKSCVVSLNLTNKRDFFVCIKAFDSSYDDKYSLNSENINPCGFYDNLNNGLTRDYQIFAKGGKYSNVGSFNINANDNLKNEINNYLYRYINNCSQGCVIPIKFISGTEQEIILSDLNFKYSTVEGPSGSEANKFYNTEKIPAKISMNFQKLDLEKSGLTVPDSYGERVLSLKLGGSLILEKDIEIMRVPIINLVIPQELPAAIPIKFIVFVSGGDISSYSWNFGDGTVVNTTTNTTTHIYSSKGIFNLKISVSNNVGEASKTFPINVKSPEEMINYTLAAKRKNLNDVKKQLSLIVGWYKSKLEKQAGLDDLDSELKNLERKYEIASTSKEYIDIMSNLTGLEIPYALQVSESSSGDYFPDVNQINPSYLTEVDKEVDNPSSYKNSIINWFNENINMQLERKVYSLYYDDKTEPLVTIFVLKIKPKQDFSRESYLIIDKNYDELTFKENYNEKNAGSATAITFSELNTGQEKTIEFVVSGKIEMLGLPIYVSSEFSQLPEPGEISPCNFNNECEPELDETWKNCRNDCKPWGWVVIWMIILLFFAFVAYILLQEWYKRYYENHLFKNKNELYNLIYFINNALNQSYSIEEIIKTLKKHNWKAEQIAYALKKVKGERTGMWEIPVFKWLEKRKIEEEIRKRQQMQTLKKSFQQSPR